MRRVSYHDIRDPYLLSYPFAFPFQADQFGQYTWAQRHTKDGWRERYRKNQGRLDQRIAEIVEENPPPPDGMGGYKSRRYGKLDRDDEVKAEEFMLRVREEEESATDNEDGPVWVKRATAEPQEEEDEEGEEERRPAGKEADAETRPHDDDSYHEEEEEEEEEEVRTTRRRSRAGPSPRSKVTRRRARISVGKAPASASKRRRTVSPPSPLCAPTEHEMQRPHRGGKLPVPPKMMTKNLAFRHHSTSTSPLLRANSPVPQQQHLPNPNPNPNPNLILNLNLNLNLNPQSLKSRCG